MVWTLDCQGDRGGEPCWPCDHAPDVLTQWPLTLDGGGETDTGPEGVVPHGTAEPGSRPVHSTRATTSTAPPAALQQQLSSVSRVLALVWFKGQGVGDIEEGLNISDKQEKMI